jgi:hypothetical protein
MATKEFEKQSDLKRFSLGVEEFALILGLVGKPKDGHIVLAAAYEDISQIDMDALLSSASHSLLARNFCFMLPNTDQPVLDKGLKQAIACLLNYNQVMYLNVLTGNAPIQLTIHINSPKAFCAHLNKANMVHLLEYGSWQSLGVYLADSLDAVVFPTDTMPDSFEAEIPFLFLSSMTKPQGEPIDVTSLLKNKGWSSERVNMLAEDLAYQTLRGTLLRVQTDDVESSEKYAQAAKTTLLFLRGKERVWIFRFDTPDESAIGLASIIDRKGFDEALKALVK